ncbi:MAG: LPS export ABC transporter periplasmic protein LptC [Ignavibacteriae bacterium]|nr:LPS export ABC transporter periplasmic protein LptC [Ignavibacteria bacterium]MBI3365217.1 LPS export ABC transporter periplasmic protein LptC [Ignavibacteriota bacterium]
MQKSKVKSKKAATDVFVMFVVLCTLLSACSEEKMKPAISSASIGYDIPTQESWNATITFTDSGRVTGILHAGHIAMFSDKRSTLLDSSITVDFYDRQQRHTSILTAKWGRVNDVTHDFEAHDNVVVVSDSGTTLRTEELFWNNRTQKVTTTAFVDIKSPAEHLQGHGFESDQSLNHYTIFKVTGQAKPNE